MNQTSRSIVEALARHAERSPERCCIRWNGAEITYGRLMEQTRRLARGLRALGIGAGERVALVMDNAPDYIASYLAIQLAGGVAVLVNPQYRAAELLHILNDAEPRLALVDQPHRALLEQTRPAAGSLERIVEPAELPVPGSPELPLPLPDGEALAVLAYTSGTTGRSKGAMLLHRNLHSNAQAICRAWEWSADDRLLLTLPLFHAHGLFVGVHGTLLSGASLELHARFDAAEVLTALAAGDISMFFGVPTMYARLLDEASTSLPDRPGAARSSGLPALRLYVSGSAPLSPQLFAAFEAAAGQPILERYGMTETAMNLTNPYRGERRAGTVGLPFPGQAARVVDLKTRLPLPADSDGEIEVRGPHVFAGYWRQPEATAACFDRDGWFRTGDLGRVSADGYVTITGRLRELIISGGFNVYPREVEEVLAQCPGVREVAVLGLPDPDLGERVTAAVVASDPALSAETVIAFCRERLAPYKKPREVVFRSALPRNALGKVEKHVLREQLIT